MYLLSIILSSTLISVSKSSIGWCLIDVSRWPEENAEFPTETYTPFTGIVCYITSLKGSY